MRLAGQLGLLVAFIGAGFSAFACLMGGLRNQRALVRAGHVSAWIASLGLTSTLVVLAIALVTRDFSYQYVAHYASSSLPWYFCLSALWVGQAGSLLLWSWLSLILALTFLRRSQVREELREPAFGLLMGYVSFLVAVMVFAADPLRPGLQTPEEGSGLSPLLQHPTMLIHPPVVFAAYAMWSIPWAIGTAALFTGRLDSAWLSAARPWSLLAWAILGAGILLGAHWAYQELGWGGYWGWDPVENGSLLPWLTGTAFLHGLLVWKHQGSFKRTTLALSVANFALCNFATFLTRSGVFSSVHAFSKSPIGWMFLGLMGVLLFLFTVLIWKNRKRLESSPLPPSIWSRESLMAISMLLFVLFTVVVLAGTLITPISLLAGRAIMIGPEFYNTVLAPVGMILLTLTAIVPLLHWRRGPSSHERNLLLLVTGIVLAGCVAAYITLRPHPLLLAVLGSASVMLAATAAAAILAVRRYLPGSGLFGVAFLVSRRRQEYAAYLIHLGIACLAIGISGSSLGTERKEVRLERGDVLEWAGRQIRYTRLHQRELDDKLIAEAELEIKYRNGRVVVLKPAKHLHLLQNEWTTEVDIDATWSGDFYTILHAGEGGGVIQLTLVSNPLMRCLWLGGWLAGGGAFVAIWPARRRAIRSQQFVGRTLRTVLAAGAARAA